MTVKALVLEGDGVSRQQLVELLSREPRFAVVGKPTEAREAQLLIERLAPHAVFLDSDLESAWDLNLRQDQPDAPLLVTTARCRNSVSSELARASMALLLRPFTYKPVHSLVKSLIERLGSTLPARMEPAAPVPADTYGSTLPPASQILLAYKDELRPVRFEEIVYIESQNGGTVVRTVKGTYEATATLHELEQRLPAREFVRIHRRHIINRSYIATLRRWGNRQLKVELTVPTAADLFVSRRSYNAVVDRLGGMP